MVPEADFRSYYGDPVVNAPVWQAREIASYFFLGGLAGASSLVAVGAELTGAPKLARASKLTAAVGISLSLGALVKDSWTTQSVRQHAAGVQTDVTDERRFVDSCWLRAARDWRGRERRHRSGGGLGRKASLGAAFLGPAVAAYTGALIADSSIPAWHDAYREMPFLFVSSAACAAAGAGLLFGNEDGVRALTRLAAAGMLADVTLEQVIERRLGPIVAAPYRSGRSGLIVRLSRILTAGGALGRRSRERSLPFERSAGLPGPCCSPAPRPHALVCSTPGLHRRTTRQQPSPHNGHEPVSDTIRRRSKGV